MSSASDYSDVFISYRRKDVEFVKQLVEELRKSGKEVWIDWEDIAPGSVGFTGDIQRGLDGADMFLCVLTPDYLESTYCVDMELGYAVKNNKKIIPIVLKKFDGYNIPDGIGHINWIYFTPHAGQNNDFIESFPRIIEAMEADLDHIRKHKNYHLRAIEWQQNNRATSFLLDGDEITAAEDWLVNASGKNPLPTDMHKDYVTLSRQYENRKQRLLMAGVVSAMIVTVVLAILAVGFGFDALRQREIAEVAREQAELLAAQVQALFLADNATSAKQEGDPILALALAQRAIEHLEEPTPQLMVDYANLVYEPGPRLAFTPDTGIVTNMVVSRNQAYVATSTCLAEGVICENPALLIWNPETWDVRYTLSGITGEVTAFAFDRNSERIAVTMCAEVTDSNRCTRGTHIAVYSLADGRELLRWSGQAARIADIAFNETGDYLVTGSWDATVVVWNALDGTQVQMLDGHEGEVSAVAFANDGRWILSIGCSENCTGGDLIVWDAANGDVLQWHTNIAASETPLLILDSRHQALFESINGELLVWEIRQGRERYPVPQPLDSIQSLWVNAQETQLITTNSMRHIAVWTLPENVPPMNINTFTIADGELVGAGLANNSQQLISGFEDDLSLIVWDLTNGAIIQSFDDFSGAAHILAMSPDGTQAAVLTEDTQITVLDMTTGSILQEWQTDELLITHMAYSPDGNWLATVGCVAASGSCTEFRIRLWNTSDGTVWKDIGVQENRITGFAFSPDGAAIVAHTQDKQVLVWHVADGTMVNSLALPDENIIRVEFLQDDTTVVIVTSEKIHLWNSVDNVQTATLASDEHEFVNAILLPDVNIVATVDDDGQVIYWDVTTQQQLSRALVVTAGEYHMSVGGSYLFVAARETVSVLDMSGNVVREYHDGQQIEGLAINAAGSRLLTATENNLQLWRVDTFAELLAWAASNRYITDLTCEEAANYLIEGSCEN